MTDEELEIKAANYSLPFACKVIFMTDIEKAYIAGAKENLLHRKEEYNQNGDCVEQIISYIPKDRTDLVAWLQTARDFGCDNDWLATELEKKNAPVWHDLRKNPADLPKDNHGVIAYDCERFMAFFENGQFFRGNVPHGAVIAWCEIPKFEED